MKSYYHFHEEAYRQILQEKGLGWGKAKDFTELGDPATLSYLENEIKNLFHEQNLRKDNLTALDLGCGSGVTSILLKRMGFSVLGLDISDTAINMAQSLAKKMGLDIQFKAWDVLQLSKLNKQFDLIYDSHFFHCIVFNEDRQQALVEISKSLKKDGVFILDTMVMKNGLSLVNESDFLRFDENYILWHKTNSASVRGVMKYQNQLWCPQRRIYPQEQVKEEVKNAGFNIISETRDEQKAHEPAMLRLVLKSNQSLGLMEKLTFEETLKIAIDQTLEGIQVLNHDWEYIYVNTAAARHGRTTKEKLIGSKMVDCYPGIDKTPFFQEMVKVKASGVAKRLENFFEYPDQQTCWFELFIEPHSEGILIRSMDITDRKRLEGQYLQAQKLEAIGQIAGGVAHDFNNKLGIILAYGEMVLAGLQEQNGRLKSHTEKIIKAVHQASQLTKQLLAFSQKQVLNLKTINLNELLKDINDNLVKILGDKISVKYSLQGDLGFVQVDAFQMEQLILNLCTNARDAMPNGGDLLIETFNLNLDSEYIKTKLDVSPGQYIMLSVTDNGSGMDQKTLARVFEPFFTTKERGKGTGLGLAMAHGFVSQSNGYIWPYSELARGSVFKVYLPRVHEAAGQDVVKQTQEKKYKGHEVILLTEDEPSLREGFTAVLTDAGYKVLTAKNAEEALQIFSEQSDQIDLLLTDVILPATTGPELAKSLLMKKKDLKVVYMSGYTENFISQTGILNSDEVLLQKPISSHKLLENIRGVLDNSIKKAVV